MKFAPSIPLALVVGLAWSCGSRTLADDPAPDFAPVRDFLQRHCLDCHGQQDPQAELSLTRFQDGDALVKERKVWNNVLRMVVGGEMPPKDRPQPDVAAVDAFVTRIEAILAHHDRHAPPDPGRVTMRRLNRVEYRNTIRDLIGVDFDPTEDFPADDIGHGFDNIGDVLTVSPVLMERYLAAAESIAERAIVPNPPPPPNRHLAARYSEPASGEVEKRLLEGNYRRVSSDGQEPIEVGPLQTPYQWVDDGEYIFRTKVYGRSEGDGPVRVAVLVSGKDLPEPSSDAELAALVGNVPRPARLLQTFEIQAAAPEAAQVLEVHVPPMPGRERMLVALMKPAEGAPAARLYVESLSLKGPLDTRPASHRRLLACSPDKSVPEQTREVLQRFLRRAYRRPPTAEELERVAALVDQTVQSGSTWEAGMQLAIQAVLCSPKFLFRAELDDRPGDPQMRRLDDFALASRLSYFLWNTMPDDELLDLAEQRQLSAQLEPQVRRMLADVRSASLVENFALQWLQLQRLQSLAPDNQLFPNFNDRLRRAMLQETVLFVTSVLQEDRSILDLVDADYTYLNETLAQHYGIVDTRGNLAGRPPVEPRGEPIRGREFQRVTLQDRSRGGLLLQASILTVTSNPTRTSPVKRGRWVLEQLLGAPPPPPPPNVPELPADEQAVATGSLRQRLEVHRANPSCANCHAKMDPIGFALENYNAIGGFRTHDGEFEIDPSGELPDGTHIDGAAGLKSILRERKHEFTRCLAEKLLTYALGRGLEYYDNRAIGEIVAATARGDDRFSALVLAIVQSDPFRQRRGGVE